MMDYKAFREYWLEQHPSSIPVKRNPSRVGWKGRIAWLAVYAASAIISGVHTVPVVLASIPLEQIAEIVRYLAGLAGFVMIELAIFLSARYRSSGRVSLLVMILSTITAVVANIYSAVAELLARSPNPFTVIVGIAIGLTAPLVALLAGEMYSRLDRHDRALQERADKEYAEAQLEMDKKISAAFTKYTKQQAAVGNV